MGFQPINFASLPNEESPYKDLLGTLMRGYELGTKPAQIAQEMANAKAKEFKEREEGRFMAPLAESLIGQRAAGSALDKAQAQRVMQEANNPFSLAGGLSGVAREALGVELLKKQYGENSPVYINAKRAFQNNLASGEMLNNYRQSLIDTSGKRAATSLGKTYQEQLEAEQGYVPGTSKKERLTPALSNELTQNYQLARQKNISDTGTRAKVLYATNIHKTLSMIDSKALTQYSGIPGSAKQKAEEARAALGYESKDYAKYQRSLIAADTLAKQVRQFYGDSIQPAMEEKLNRLTNPSSWRTSPKLAEQNFNQFKKILERETETYKGGLKSTKEFESPKRAYEPTPSTSFTDDDIKAVAKENGVTIELARNALLKAGHKYMGGR